MRTKLIALCCFCIVALLGCMPPSAQAASMPAMGRDAPIALSASAQVLELPSPGSTWSIAGYAGMRFANGQRGGVLDSGEVVLYRAKSWDQIDLSVMGGYSNLGAAGFGAAVTHTWSNKARDVSLIVGVGGFYYDKGDISAGLVGGLQIAF